MDSNSAKDTTLELPSLSSISSPPPPPQVSSADVRVDLAAGTHVGKVRSRNEDNFHVVQFGRFFRTLLTSMSKDDVPNLSQETGYGFAVADGMGGMAAGDFASRLAIMHFVQLILETPDWILSDNEPYINEVIDRTARRFKEVNAAVIERAEAQPNLSGMGSTLSLAFSYGDLLVVANVGDSPAMLSSDGKLHRLTDDHTLGERMSRQGLPNAKRFHHVLTNAIGMRETGGEPDIRRFRLADGDSLLICSDGLTRHVNDATIASELTRNDSASVICDSLIAKALEGGGTDNVTVIVARYQIPERGSD